MNRFTEADLQNSAAMDTVAADPVSFKPMRPINKGRRVVLDTTRNQQTHEPDPDREARPRDANDVFVAIVSWRTDQIDSARQGSSRDATVATDDVMLDFDRGRFMTPQGEKLPMPGDLFEIETESGDTVVVQQARWPVDDGARRIIVFCIAPE